MAQAQQNALVLTSINRHSSINLENLGQRQTATNYE